MLKAENKFYTSSQVWWACVLGGPLVGSYLVSKNCANFGQEAFARKLLILSVIISLILIAVFIATHEYLLFGMPKWVYRTIPLSYTVFWASYVESFQGRCIKNNSAQGWQKYSAKWVTLLALLSLAVSLLYTMFIGLLI